MLVPLTTGPQARPVFPRADPAEQRPAARNHMPHRPSPRSGRCRGAVPCHGRYHARMRAMSAAMSSVSANGGPMPMTLSGIVEIGRQDRHVGGPGDLPEPGLPALDRFARAFRRQAEPELVGCPMRAASCSTTPCAAVRSTAITPSRRSSGPSGHQNSSCLPRILMSSPSASLAAKPQTPSQLDECGAPTSTSLGMSGKAPTMRHPPTRRMLRPNQRAKRLGGTRGAFGGSGNTGRGCRPSVCVGMPLAVSPSRAACAPA